MSIDKIGKAGGYSNVGPTDLGSTSKTASTETFSIERTAKTKSVEATTPLDKLNAGQVDLQGYLDMRVQEATSHLEGRLDPSQLEFIRSALRSELEHDPGLVDLVKRATDGAVKATDNG